MQGTPGERRDSARVIKLARHGKVKLSSGRLEAMAACRS